MHKFTYAKRFQTGFRQLQPTEKKQLRNKLTLFSENPFHPSLRTKRIQGADSLFEFSVNMSIRVIWSYQGTGTIILLDVATMTSLNGFRRDMDTSAIRA